MNLIPDILKSEINQAMTNVFDTFSRESQVTFYKMPNEEVVALDPNFHGGFSNTFDLSTVSSAVNSETFNCRVIYLDRQEYSTFIEGGEDVGVNGRFLHNRIRLQCKEDAFAFLKETERFVFLDEKYALEAPWERLGILGTFQCYQVILKRVV